MLVLWRGEIARIEFDLGLGNDYFDLCNDGFGVIGVTTGEVYGGGLLFREVEDCGLI